MNAFINVNHLLSTVTKKGRCCVDVSLPSLPVKARVVKASPIHRGLAAVSFNVADFHHSFTITFSLLDAPCLYGDAGHFST